MNSSLTTKNNGGWRFAPDGRRNNDDGTSSRVSTKYNPMARASSGLSRMPFSGALSRASVSAGLGKKFQLPMFNNNSSYSTKDGEEKSLKTSTLGQKRRFDGMSNLMARAGKGVRHKKKEQSGIKRGDSTSKENQGVEESTSHTNNDVRVDCGGATETSAASMELEVGSKGSVEKGYVEMEQETGDLQRSSLNREGDSRYSNGAELAAVSQEVIEQLTYSSPADGKRTSPQQQRDDNDGEDSPPKEVSL